MSTARVSGSRMFPTMRLRNRVEKAPTTRNKSDEEAVTMVPIPFGNAGQQGLRNLVVRGSQPTRWRAYTNRRPRTVAVATRAECR